MILWWKIMSFRWKKALGFPARMKPHWRRFWKDLKGLVNNGVWCNCCDECYTPREDISHAFVNLFVELWRETAYLMGHVLAIGFVLGVGYWMVSIFGGA
jgi:hypothetical protein